MLTMRKCEIPEYLQRGELFQTLTENNADPEEEVTFPANVLKLDSSVQSLEDCDRLLESLRFWGVNNFPSKEVVHFVLQNPSMEIVNLLQKYESEREFVRALCVVAVATIPSDAAAKCGSVEIVSYLLETVCQRSNRIAAIAAAYGHVPILRLLNARGQNIGITETYEAIVGGHLDCIKYIHSINGRAVDSDPLHRWQELSAELGHVHILRYLLELGKGCSSSVCKEAAMFGNLSCLQLAHKWNAFWDENICHNAALRGFLDCLKFAHEHGCPWGIATCNASAMFGHLSCLMYAHENGCPWDTSTSARAVEWRRLDCLQYALERGCPCDESACSIAASNGDLYCLTMLHEHGCPWQSNTCDASVENEYLDCLQYAHEHGCPIFLPMDIDESNPCYEYVQQHGNLRRTLHHAPTDSADDSASIPSSATLSTI